MRLKFPWNPLGLILLWAIPLSLPFSLAGCGQMACITWSEKEGACPAPEDALMSFQNPACPSSILSVDSEGAFANDLCCYEVSKLENEVVNSNFSCFPGGGGEGGFGGTVDAIAVTTGGSTPPPPPLPCFPCAQALEDLGASAGNICSKSKALFDLVKSCMCEGDCAADCKSNFCSFSDANSACLGCVGDTTTECGLAFDKCASDVNP